MQRLVELLAGRPADNAERWRYLNTLLTDESANPGTLWWALRRAFAQALAEDNAEFARDLVDRFGGRLASSDLRGYAEYLSALLLVHDGRFDEALPVIHAVDEWLADAPYEARQLSEAEHLPARNLALLGTLHLRDWRPEDALSAIGEALALQPGTSLQAELQILRGDALSLLERHEAAVQAFRTAASLIAAAPGQTRDSALKLRQVLERAFDRKRAVNAFNVALAYLELAAELTPDDERDERLVLYQKLAHALDDAANSVANAAEGRAVSAPRRTVLRVGGRPGDRRAGPALDADLGGGAAVRRGGAGRSGAAHAARFHRGSRRGPPAWPKHCWISVTAIRWPARSGKRWRPTAG